MIFATWNSHRVQQSILQSQKKSSSLENGLKPYCMNITTFMPCYDFYAMLYAYVSIKFSFAVPLNHMIRRSTLCF